MSGRRYAGRSAGERRAERRAQLLDAALELVAAHGWEATTMTTVVRRAGLSERYFYESFAGREQLFEVLVETIGAAALAAVGQAVRRAEPTLESVLSEPIRAFIAFIDEDPRRGGVIVRVAGGGRALQPSYRAFNAGFAALVAEAIERALGHPPAPLVPTLITGATAEALVSWLDGELALEREELVARVSQAAQAIVSALDVVPPARGRT